jgi:hypothetical protein
LLKKNDHNDIANTGLVFEDAKLRILPSEAIDAKAKIINLELSHLPMLPKIEVLAGLKQSLEVFGKILDIGIVTESSTGFFMGSGYAVLNVYQDESTPVVKKFHDLSHQLSWCESTNDFFHATWNNIST